LNGPIEVAHEPLMFQLREVSLHQQTKLPGQD